MGGPINLRTVQMTNIGNLAVVPASLTAIGAGQISLTTDTGPVAVDLPSGLSLAQIQAQGLQVVADPAALDASLKDVVDQTALADQLKTVNPGGRFVALAPAAQAAAVDQIQLLEIVEDDKGAAPGLKLVEP